MVPCLDSPWIYPSPDGTHIASIDSTIENDPLIFRNQLSVVERNCSNRTPIIQQDPGICDVAWSPDGRQLLFIGKDPSGNGALRDCNQVYLVNMDGTGLVRLDREDNSIVVAPVWSPDGQLIAFRSVRDANIDIYLMNRDGSNVLRLTHSLAIEGYPTWSPQGDRLAFGSSGGGRSTIYIYGIDDGKLTPIAVDRYSFGSVGWRP
jgi:TolB protein